MTAATVTPVSSSAPHQRYYDFSQPLDDTWELITDPGWTCDLSPACAHIVSKLQAPRRAEAYLRPCAIDGDTIEFGLVPGAPKSGTFLFGLISGFEYITVELNLTTGDLRITTQEAHKRQPRLATKVPVPQRTIALHRERDALPGLPYPGARVTILIDGKPAASLGQIDFLPEALVNFALVGPGEISLHHWSIEGGPRPRPEYLNVGIWQKSGRRTTPQNVDSIIEGVRQAAAAGVQLLVTPETSVTDLINEEAMNDRAGTQRELQRLQQAVAKIKGAPYTLIGYGDFASGKEIEGAEVDWVRINRHRFVRPDGTLGPPMAKVHSCEAGTWHGRNYNLQRVLGVEVALGVCHDGHYQDVWAVPVMGGARLCLHPSDGGQRTGKIPAIVDSMRGLGTNLDAFWVFVNAGGGGGVIYPTSNRKWPNTVLAVPKDLTEQSPTYPEYTHGGDLLAHARVRLWDATGCYPLRTLRSGRQGYESWSRLIPSIVDV